MPALVQLKIFILYIFFGGLQCVGNSFAYVAHFVFLRDVLIRTQRAAVASRRVTLTTHLPVWCSLSVPVKSNVVSMLQVASLVSP
jgi:hypothetical protein